MCDADWNAPPAFCPLFAMSGHPGRLAALYPSGASRPRKLGEENRADATTRRTVLAKVIQNELILARRDLSYLKVHGMFFIFIRPNNILIG